jgi:hypothetical protein
MVTGPPTQAFGTLPEGSQPAKVAPALFWSELPESKLITFLICGDHHIARFDNGMDHSPCRKLEILGRLPGDDRDDLDTIRKFYRYLGVDRSLFNLLDGTLNLVSCADLHWLFLPLRIYLTGSIPLSSPLGKLPASAKSQGVFASFSQASVELSKAWQERRDVSNLAFAQFRESLNEINGREVIEDGRKTWTSFSNS